MRDRHKQKATERDREERSQETVTKRCRETDWERHKGAEKHTERKTHTKTRLGDR